MTITPKTSVAVDLPADFSLFTVGAYSGLDIKLSAGTIIKATLITSTATGAAATIAADMQVACLHFDAEANSYSYIDGASYKADKTMTVDLPKAGFYAFVSASLTVPIPTIYAEARVTSSTSVKTISYGGGELTLEVQTTTDNKITCTKKSSSTTATPTGNTSIGAFFDIELEKEEKVKKGEIKYKYDAAAVKAVRSYPSHSTCTHKELAHTYEHTHVHVLFQPFVTAESAKANPTNPKCPPCFFPLVAFLRREQARRRFDSCSRTKQAFGQRSPRTILKSTSAPRSS